MLLKRERLWPEYFKEFEEDQYRWLFDAFDTDKNKRVEISSVTHILKWLFDVPLDKKIWIDIEVKADKYGDGTCEFYDFIEMEGNIIKAIKKEIKYKNMFKDNHTEETEVKN